MIGIVESIDFNNVTVLHKFHICEQLVTVVDCSQLRQLTTVTIITYCSQVFSL